MEEQSIAPFAMVLVIALGGAAILWRSPILRAHRGVWACAWLAACYFASSIAATEYYLIFTGSMVVAFGIGWVLGRFTPNGWGKIAGAAWAALPVATIIAWAWPKGDRPDMSGFLLVLFAPIFAAWIVTALLGVAEGRGRQRLS